METGVLILKTLKMKEALMEDTRGVIFILIKTVHGIEGEASLELPTVNGKSFIDALQELSCLPMK